MPQDEISVKELEQLYDKCDGEGVPTEEEIQALIDALNKDAKEK